MPVRVALARLERRAGTRRSCASMRAQLVELGVEAVARSRRRRARCAAGSACERAREQRRATCGSTRQRGAQRPSSARRARPARAPRAASGSARERVAQPREVARARGAQRDAAGDALDVDRAPQRSRRSRRGALRSREQRLDAVVPRPRHAPGRAAAACSQCRSSRLPAAVAQRVEQREQRRRALAARASCVISRLRRVAGSRRDELALALDASRARARAPPAAWRRRSRAARRRRRRASGTSSAPNAGEAATPSCRVQRALAPVAVELPAGSGARGGTRARSAGALAVRRRPAARRARCARARRRPRRAALRSA